MKTILLFLLVSSSAFAGDLCTTTTSTGHPVILNLGDTAATVELQSATNKILNIKRKYDDLADLWDGSLSGLITALGFSLKYERHYGCLRNLELTTNLGWDGQVVIETVSFASCESKSCSRRRPAHP